MNFKKIAFLAGLGCFAPVATFATVVYVPANPCACDSRPYDDSVILSRDFRKQGVVKQVETPKMVGNRKIQKQTKQKSGNDNSWRRYASVSFAVNMWTWENDYSSDYSGTDLLFSQDSYSAQSVFGGAVALGTKITDSLRTDLELGMDAKFEDKDEAATYTLTGSYLMLNMYRDFSSGLYIGAGMGVVKTKATIDGLLFNGSTGSPETVSNEFKAAATVGYGARLSENLFLDVQYRLSGFKAPDVSRNFWWDQYNNGTYQEYVLKIKGGLLIENTISAGLRFVF